MLHEFAGYDFYKVPLIQAIIKTFASDTICLSETFFEFFYCYPRSTHQFWRIFFAESSSPGDTNRRSVCIYYKEFVPLIKKNGATNQSECVGTETMFYLHLLVPS